MYDGNIDAKVMFVGEAQGEEDEMGVPFVGRQGNC